MAVAPELLAAAPEMFADANVAQLIKGAGLSRAGVTAVMEKSGGPDAFLRHLRALQPKPPSSKPTPSTRDELRPSLRRPSSRGGASPAPRASRGGGAVPGSPRQLAAQANPILFKLVLAGGLGLLVLEAMSKFTGQYFQFNYNQVPAKAKAVFGAAASDPKNAAPDRYAYRDLYDKTPHGADQHQTSMSGPATAPTAPPPAGPPPGTFYV